MKSPQLHVVLWQSKREVLSCCQGATELGIQISCICGNQTRIITVLILESGMSNLVGTPPTTRYYVLEANFYPPLKTFLQWESRDSNKKPQKNDFQQSLGSKNTIFGYGWQSPPLKGPFEAFISASKRTLLMSDKTVTEGHLKGPLGSLATVVGGKIPGRHYKVQMDHQDRRKKCAGFFPLA